MVGDMVFSGQEVSGSDSGAQGCPRTYLRTLCTPVHHSAHEAPNVPLAQAASVSLQANQLRELFGLWRGIRRALGPAPRELARRNWGGCQGSWGHWSCHGSGPGRCETQLQPAAALCQSVRPGAFDPTQFPFLTSVPPFPSSVCVCVCWPCACLRVWLPIPSLIICPRPVPVAHSGLARPATDPNLLLLCGEDHRVRTARKGKGQFRGCQGRTHDGRWAGLQASGTLGQSLPRGGGAICARFCPGQSPSPPEREISGT